MASEQEIIARKIESGEYYSEAMQWFHEKFTRPRTEFSYFFIICVLAVIALLIGIAAFSRIFPLSPGENFVMGRALGPRENLRISSISKAGDTANDSLMKFMLSEYVQAREEYIEDKLSRNFRIIKKFSGSDVLDQYLDDTAVTNPQNPVILYGKQAVINISIDRVQLLDALGKPAHDANVKRAIVNYTTILTFVSDNHQETAQRQADITFQYKQIAVNQETGAISQKPEMSITSYKTNPLKTAQNSKTN